MGSSSCNERDSPYKALVLWRSESGDKDRNKFLLNQREDILKQPVLARHLWACFDLMFTCMISINENNKHAINYLLSLKNQLKELIIINGKKAI
jgi:hypothetical protein